MFIEQCPHPALKQYLLPTASIICNPHLENGLEKILNGQESTLSHNEIRYLTKFTVSKVAETESSIQNRVTIATTGTFSSAFNIKRIEKEQAEALEMRIRNVRSVSTSLMSNYIPLTYIPATSCHVERLFSRAKLTFFCTRSRMKRNLWNAFCFCNRMQHIGTRNWCL